MASGVQDMPPPGGYRNVDWAKKLPKTRMSGYKQFGLFCAFTTAAWIGHVYEQQHQQRQELELREARIAIQPLLMAEKHRLYLMQLRANRDEENELMKDVPGWKTGTLWGEPIYNNIRNRHIVPSAEEYFAHCSQREMYLAVFEKLKH